MTETQQYDIGPRKICFENAQSYSRGAEMSNKRHDLIQTIDKIDQEMASALDIVQISKVEERIQVIREDSKMRTDLTELEKPSTEAEEAARSVAKELASWSFPMPRIERGDDNSFVFMWRTHRWAIDLEVFPDDSPIVCIFDKDKKEPYTCTDLTSAKDRLHKLLSVRATSFNH